MNNLWLNLLKQILIAVDNEPEKDARSGLWLNMLLHTKNVAKLISCCNDSLFNHNYLGFRTYSSIKICYLTSQFYESLPTNSTLLHTWYVVTYIYLKLSRYALFNQNQSI